MPRFAASILLAVLLVASPGVDADESRRGGFGDVEPTPEETLYLEFMNRARADPAAEARRVRAWARSIRAGWARRVDWDLFLKEVSALDPVPPLVLEPHLVLAARRHAAYVKRHHEVTHVEVKGREGFTGVDYWDRAESAGYGGFTSGENVGIGLRNVEYAHAIFVVDYALTSAGGGMLPGRGHRVNVFCAKGKLRSDFGGALIGDDTEVGIAQLFGIGQSPRSIGGAAYLDRNGNAFYDIGEGLRSVRVAVEDGASIATSASGAYRLTLAPGRAARVVAMWEGMRLSMQVPASQYGAWFSPAFPSTSLRKLVDDHLDAHGVAHAADDDARALEVALLLDRDIQGRALDEDRANRARAVTEQAVAQLAAAKSEVLRAMAELGRKEAATAIRCAAKPFKETIAANWFEDARAVLPARQRVDALLAKRARGRKPNRSAVASTVRMLKSLEGRLQTSEWGKEIRRLLEALE